LFIKRNDEEGAGMSEKYYETEWVQTNWIRKSSIKKIIKKYDQLTHKGRCKHGKKSCDICLGNEEVINDLKNLLFSEAKT
jgi:hypothetical protein